MAVRYFEDENYNIDFLTSIGGHSGSLMGTKYIDDDFNSLEESWEVWYDAWKKITNNKPLPNGCNIGDNKDLSRVVMNIMSEVQNEAYKILVDGLMVLPNQSSSSNTDSGSGSNSSSNSPSSNSSTTSNSSISNYIIKWEITDIVVGDVTITYHSGATSNYRISIGSSKNSLLAAIERSMNSVEAYSNEYYRLQKFKNDVESYDKLEGKNISGGLSGSSSGSSSGQKSDEYYEAMNQHGAGMIKTGYDPRNNAINYISNYEGITQYGASYDAASVKLTVPLEYIAAKEGTSVEHLQSRTSTTLMNLQNKYFDEWRNTTGMAFEYALFEELKALDGTNLRNPDTGRFEPPGNLLSQYTNRLFGAPYQLMDSVDRRFGVVNENVGAEYLRNFLLNSPILHIRPGMPKYTGGEKGLTDAISEILLLSKDPGAALWKNIAEKTILRKGSQLQRRMFGFRETYLSYMSHVNYMCRSVAIYLGLIESAPVRLDQPIGTFVNTRSTKEGHGKYLGFSQMRWENYRYISTYVNTVTEQLGAIFAATGGKILGSIGSFFEGLYDSAMKFMGDENMLQDYLKSTEGSEDTDGTNEPTKSKLPSIDDIGSLFEALPFGVPDYEKSEFMEIKDAVYQAARGFDPNLTEGGVSGNTYDEKGIWNASSEERSLYNVLDQKIRSVSFMVDPISYNESLNNVTAPSAIAGAIDALENGIGSEIAFITNSHADVGVVGNLAKFLGGTLDSLSTGLANITETVTGGFLGGLFKGAIGSIKGQKMIYPDIYKQSSSSLNYEFSVTLSTPYGDPYNYYMNILVPLLHLIALTAPRMVSANSTTSPFLVQAYMPGMVTCQLGIIEQMNITKNPTTKHVSVNGFPLTVKVQFTIKELYNALSISPANDPVSFVFNETLNDYLTNLAGLIPSMSMFAEQQSTVMANLSDYFTATAIGNDLASGILEKVENTFLSGMSY